MHEYIARWSEKAILHGLSIAPVVAILGPRQCGKSTLAKQILTRWGDSDYLDLEKPSHANRLRDPEAYFALSRGKLVCLDEIQRVPQLFPVIKGVVDEVGGNGHFLVLGSASPDLLRQGSETLAGRIRFQPLTPFLFEEVESASPGLAERRLWLRGGFPRSYLAPDDRESAAWRNDFIQTFLERDIPQLGLRIPAETLRRFWQMAAHVHGQLFNASRIGESLGVSHHTARGYLDVLEQTFLLRILQPLEANLKKRLVKSPKLYVRDSGILHALLGIETAEELLGHPVYGHSWEGFAVENILSRNPDWQACFYRSATGDEIDLVLTRGNRRIAVECKASSAPEPPPGFLRALRDLGIREAWIVAPVANGYPLGSGVTVTPLGGFLDALESNRADA
jgi:predicted AAA+ superfamily ATPase